MKTCIVPIGDSFGIVIPKRLLKKIGLSREVDVCLQDNTLVIRPISSPRSGWAEAFQEAARLGDDVLRDDPPANLSSWDEQW